MSQNIYRVKWAVYGAMNGGTNIYYTKDIAAKVDALLTSGTTTITFDNETFTDPCFGFVKAFAVSVNVNGNEFVYAGTEGQVVDFTRAPVDSSGRSRLMVTNLQASLVPGGWPTPTDNFLFNACTLTITNSAALPFPPDAQTSSWVAVDFYISASNSTIQPTSGMIKIGDQGVNVGSLPHNGQIQVNVASLVNGLFDISRSLTGGRNILPPGVAQSYLYAQVRNSDGTIKFGDGAFSPAPFPINVQ